MAHGGPCLHAGAHPHLGAWDSKWKSKRAAGVAGFLKPLALRLHTCPPGHHWGCLQGQWGVHCSMGHPACAPWGAVIHLTGAVVIGAGSQGGDDKALPWSGGCCSMLGPGWQHAAVSSHVGAHSLCPWPEESSQTSPCPEIWGHLSICLHACLHRPFPCWWPWGCPLHLQPWGFSPGTPGGEAPLSPPRRGPSCADGSSTAPGRSLHPHVRSFLCPSWLCAGLAPSVPSPPPPAPPSQPPPEPATHTSELFCVFQQLKRIKQQLSPGRAWILVTLIFCVAGQGEWGY